MSLPSITCALCHAKSHNAHDISHLYCGRCHKYHEHVSDYVLDPSLDLSETTENYDTMAAACQIWLLPAQREVIACALEARPNAMANGCGEHSGKVLHPQKFAELLLELAVKANELPKDDPE